MKKEVTLKFRKGRYELIYSENGYTQQVSWVKMIAELFGGWQYDPEEEVLTIEFKYGNSIVEKDYDCPFNPEDISKMEYNVKFNKEIKKLFKKLQEDYDKFIQEIKSLEFEEQIFYLEY
jgi:hypothetical protein